jgi:hypothetical protein
MWCTGCVCVCTCARCGWVIHLCVHLFREIPFFFWTRVCALYGIACDVFVCVCTLASKYIAMYAVLWRVCVYNFCLFLKKKIYISDFSGVFFFFFFPNIFFCLEKIKVFKADYKKRVRGSRKRAIIFFIFHPLCLCISLAWYKIKKNKKKNIYFFFSLTPLLCVCGIEKKINIFFFKKYISHIYFFFIKWKSWQDDPDLLERGEILCPCERRTKAKAGGYFCVISSVCCYFFWYYQNYCMHAGGNLLYMRLFFLILYITHTKGVGRLLSIKNES